MPGFLPHLIAGSALFVVGRFCFKKYFDNKLKEQIILLVVCLSFSLIPDFFLGLYYTTHAFPFSLLLY